MTQNLPDDEVADIRRLARQLGLLVQRSHQVLDETATSATLAEIERILGIRAADALVVETTLPLWTHASCQEAVASLVEADPVGATGRPEDGPARWFGLGVRGHMHQPLASVLPDEPQFPTRSLPAPAWGQVPVGPSETMAVLTCGLAAATAPTGEPVVVCLRQTQIEGPPSVSIGVVAAALEPAQATLDRLRHEVDANSRLRGQVLSFGASENWGNSLVTFLPRPRVAADDIVLPVGVLSQVTDHVIGIGAAAENLRRYGVHLKRGVLLHGPPGTGKTHTVRHLIGLAEHATVVVLTGQGLQFIEMAAALARQLAPSIVVCEDVDLVAEDRSYGDSTNPLLFQLLDAMDGVAGDADVTFLLTTNRADALERALVQRPGRIDLAVEIGKPDEAGRERLLRLYSGSMPVEADLAVAASRLAGATASAMKEVMRRASLAALRSDEDSPVVTQALLDGVLDVYLDDQARLTRSLLGASEGLVMDAENDGEGVGQGWAPDFGATEPGLAP